MKLNYQNYLLVVIIVCFSCFGYSQVGINTTNPQAQLDVKASDSSAPLNTDGLLIPRIDTFPTTNPTISQQGMLVYLTTVFGSNQPGFYYWDNVTTSWVSISQSVLENDPQVSSSVSNRVPRWNGTSLIDGAIMDNGSFVGIGATVPQTKLHVVGTVRIEAGRLDFRNTGGTTAVGTDSGINDDQTNNYNTYVGYFSGKASTSGYDNVAIGAGALEKSTTGFFNTALGRLAGLNNLTGNRNIFLGYAAGYNETGSDKLYIDNSSTPTPLIYGDFATQLLKIHGTLNINNAYNLPTNSGFSNQILQSDGVGSTAWVDASTLLITETDPKVASAVSNYVPKWNGASLVDGKIFDNGTNVGIGTALPSEKLDVNGKTKTTDVQITNGAANGYVLQSDGLGNGSWVNPSTLIVSEIDPQVASTSSNYVPKWNGTTLVDGQVFDNGTNVGIGTASPTSKLEVVGSTSTTNFQMTNGATNGFVLQSNATGNATWVNPTSLSITETDPQVSSTTSNIIPKWNGTTLVDGQVFDNGINIGLGTTSPTDKLHVVGNIKIENGKMPFINGSNSVYVGQNAGNNDTFSASLGNIAIGKDALMTNLTSSGNTAVGFQALKNNTSNSNTAIGYNALRDNTTGSWNVSLGQNSLASNTTGRVNIGIGGQALLYNTTGRDNIALGDSALLNNTSGIQNVAIGNIAGRSNIVGSRNVFLGFSAGFNETGSDKLYIDNTNTINPLIYGDFATDLLKINGTLNINNAYNLPTVSGSANQVLQTDGSGNTAWVNPSSLAIIETDPQVSSSVSNYVPRWNGSSLVDGQVFDNGTNVGIGTSTPTQAKLVVNGFETRTMSYGYLNSSGATGSVSNIISNYSIYASHRIAASEFNAYSDVRIKNIKGISNNKQDLETLSKIEITDYVLKDSISKGNNNYKKVIAQQVEKVYPQAVSKLTDVVPDIYKQAEMVNGIIILENDLKSGEKIKIITKSGELIVNVLEANSKEFKIDANLSEKVFVFGRLVNDFRSVDYEALSTLNISATQELLKRIEQLEAENKLLKLQMKSLEQLKVEVELIKNKF